MWVPVELDGMELICPTEEQWRYLCAGAVPEIEGTPVLEARFMRMAIREAIDSGAWNTENVRTFLSRRTWAGKTLWVPLMLLWPANDQVGTAAQRVPYVKVYFRRFHCFDCGLDLYGCAVDADTYRHEDLLEVMKWVQPFKTCPRCRGGMRHPMLVQIYKVCE